MKSVMRFIATVLCLGSCMAFGFFWRDIRSLQAPSGASFSRLFGLNILSSKLTAEQVFSKNYQRILADYGRPIKPLDLKYAGIEGMVSALGDPHTNFFRPTAAKEFSDETRATFGGVGARLGPDPLGARVATVFEDGPAYASGLRAGNLITAVDGVSASGVDIDMIVDRIKGKVGTVVKLTVVQPGKEKPVVVAIRRAQIIAPTVEGSVLAGTKIGYMSIMQFSEPTADQFDHEIARLESQGITGLVIDLRGNPGGLLETAVAMLSRFVEDKPVVRMKFRTGDDEVPHTKDGGLHDFKYPIAVLIDQDSASAAEIFAGCLHDYNKATLVGTRSYGKASVQNVFTLVDHSSAKITIARYYLPAGEYIGRKVDDDGVKISGGLQPDIPVDLDTNNFVTFGDPTTDNQLKKAMSVVSSPNGVPEVAKKANASAPPLGAPVASGKSRISPPEMEKSSPIPGMR